MRRSRDADGGRGGSADRRALLETIAVEEGRRWARALRQSLAADGRRLSGGWPGTLSEARARATFVCAQRVSPGGEPTSAELEWIARKLNGVARVDWLTGAEREEPVEED